MNDDIERVIDDLDCWTLALIILKPLEGRSYSNLEENFIRRALQDETYTKYKKQRELKENNPTLYRKVDFYIGKTLYDYKEKIKSAEINYKGRKLDSSKSDYLNAIKILEEKKKVFVLCFGEEHYQTVLKETKYKLSDIYFDRYEFFIQKKDFEQAKKNLEKFEEVSPPNIAVINNYVRLYNAFKMYDKAIQFISNKAIQFISNIDKSALICDNPDSMPLLSINLGNSYAGKFVELIQNKSNDVKELNNCGKKALEFYSSVKNYIDRNLSKEDRASIENTMIYINYILSNLKRYGTDFIKKIDIEFIMVR